MIRAPFIRLALLALTTLYVLGLVLVAVWLGPWWMIAVLVGGVLLAFLLAVELPIDESETRR